MTKAPAHDKEMENLVGAEIFVDRIKKWELQRVDHAAHGVDDAACKEPEKRGERQRRVQGLDREDHDPSHADVENGGDPFRAGHPEKLKEHA